MNNAGIDHSGALAEARSKDSQMPNAQQSHPGDLHVPQRPDKYNDAQYPGNYSQGNIENNSVERLDEARKNEGRKIGGVKDTADTAKKIAETATPVGALSLLKQINFIGDMPFVAAMGAALLKDLLDFVAGPTVVLSILFSVLCSIFIFMMLLLVGASGKKKGANKILSKIAVLGAGGIADSIPGIDFLPIETITVAAIYFLTLVERKNASKE
ncbi:MAG: hypothetical protein US70_C0006G0010 [Parcubacteria group bacterium GW2011_GWD2_38_11]|nr:MAG: hypothetical protein US70_C0006G0010 [Parcubacteria group bacterium GW2011_GWD2_38_11]